MALLWPWGLIGLAAVAAAAALALRRPLQRIVPVSSLALWERALASLPAGAARSGRRVSAAWILLLVGAAAAVLAVCRPVWLAGSPARRVALAVCPAAELGEDGREALRASARALLGRLDGRDGVVLVLPAAAGPTVGPLAAPEAARRIEDLALLPAAGASLTLPEAPDVQHVYRLQPATLPAGGGPDVTTIALPARPGELTLDAFAAAAVADGRAEAFCAVRNHTDRPLGGAAVVAGEGIEPVRVAFEAPARGRRGLVVALPARPGWLRAEIDGRGQAAFLAARPAATARVGLTGRDDPLLRRFVGVHPRLVTAAETDKADAVIAVGRAAPPGSPAVTIDPPRPPPGFRRADDLANVALRDAGLLADHELLAHVDLSGVAVRRAAGWSPPELPVGGRVVVGLEGRALVVAADRPRRVYVAFDLAAENTNFATTEAFVIFMANAMRYLLPEKLRSAGVGEVGYVAVTPLRADPTGNWRPLEPSAGGTSPAGGLPAPGLYRDEAGAVHAVSLTGLRSASPVADPVRTARAAPLPPPAPGERPVPLWPVLAVAACACWLVGWACRVR